MRAISVSGAALALLAALAAAPDPVSAADDEAVGDRLHDVEQELARERAETKKLKTRAKSLGSKVENVRNEKIAVAKTILELETALSKAETELAQLRKTEKETVALLEKRRSQSVVVVSALQRLASLPPEAIIAQPVRPADLVRGAILLRATVPEIEGRVTRLRGDLAALQTTRAEIAERQDGIARRSKELVREQARLDTLLGETAHQYETVVAAREGHVRRAEDLAKQAGDLRELFDKLRREKLAREEAERQKRARMAREAQERKQREADLARAVQAEERERAERNRELAAQIPLPSIKPHGPNAVPPAEPSGDPQMYPVAGRIVDRFGEKRSTGLTRRGIDMETRPNALVVAPVDGRIVFAGNFRGYGQLLIIEHGEGYHSLLAGMARIDGTVGQQVLAGEPVGVMGNPTSGKPRLYVELRRDGQPINPVPWLVARKVEVKG